MRRALWLFVGAIALSSAVAVNGYTVSTFPAIHERLTYLSTACAKDNNGIDEGDGRFRVHCVFDDARWRDSQIASLDFRHRDIGNVAKLLRLQPLERATRWSDDPGNAGMKHRTLAKYGALLKFGCKKKDYVGTTLYDVGLMCSGHYGKLGFLHAMMSSDDWQRMSGLAYVPRISGEQARDRTRDKILAWAAFTYDVAVGKQTLGQPVCEAITSSTAYAALTDAFRDNLDKPAFCTGRADTWTVGRFFTFFCVNPSLNEPCGAIDNADDNATRTNAEGALLHMIQDSYSQSHVRRLRYGQSSGSPSPAAIVCTAPLVYYYYDPSNRIYHSSYDEEPWVDAVSCSGGAVDDPVSAGATLISMLRAGRPSTDFVTYLKQHVFPTR
ncbi:MAG: hypothetical protein E7773_10025 [Sphingomonas sp.]|uniref:hypothetical protein n=1 Tax=Sphingomonas sp. TaxID=28214 RepID=UPI00120F95A2|nr:hypothetical protein [Sphingomonas sp.]THD36243.1 MAG: hypothetical protein E7773_10025 [Sphingomonas sp.]